MSKPYTRLLADFIAGLDFSAFPEEVLAQAKLLVLDSIGNQLSGSREPAARIVTDWIAALDARQDCTIVGTGLRAPMTFAGFANGVMGHSVEMDDAHRDGLVKCGTVITPASITCSEAEGCDGKRFLTAMIGGYELMIRLGLAVNPGHRNRSHHSTATVGSFASASVAAKILGLNADTLTDAFGVAGTQAQGLSAFLDDPHSMTKPFNAGKGVMTGLFSVELAAKGLKGPNNILEGEEGFFHAECEEVDFDVIDSGLGTTWRIMEEGFKPHAACRYSHTAIDVSHQLAINHDLPGDAVERVVVRMSPLAVRQTKHKNPPHVISAEGSTSYVVALALLSKKPHLVHEDFVVAWEDPSVLEFAQRVDLEADERRFDYMGRGTEVEVFLKDGSSVVAEAALPKGEPENPMSEDEIRAKFESLAGPIVGSADTAEISAMVTDLDALEDCRELAALLGVGQTKAQNAAE
ncbi:MAG: hypothetical protein CMM48_13360 [Rhodospirillaceae bacterium]|nr:hypothetical protein [Rhodospirillaceae bacterium]